MRFQWPWCAANPGEVRAFPLEYIIKGLISVAMNHSCVHVPQNEAFLSALRNAERKVFIQTPNLNAEPLIPAIIEAVRRGIEVYYYVCLGYNDAVWRWIQVIKFMD